MIAPACRKGLRRKNGRKANFRQVQTSAARSFGSQSNHIINTASAPKRAPLPSPHPTPPRSQDLRSFWCILPP